MADIFREVDEEVRRDKAAEFWTKYQNWIIAVAILIAAGAGGWRWYEYQRRVAAEAAGAKFEEAIQLSRQGKTKEAEGAFETIARTGPTGYALLARLRAAGEAASRDPKEGIKLFDAIAADNSVDRSFREVARLRSAIMAVEQSDFDDARKRLEPLAATEGVFRHSAREMLALAAYKAGKYDVASEWLDRLIGDSQTPASLRQRAATLQALIAAGKPPEK